MKTAEGSFEPRPVFIVGALRSGASLLALSLGQHPKFALMPEMPWLGSLAQGLLRAYRDGVLRHGTAQLEITGIERDAFLAHFGAAAQALIAQSIPRLCPTDESTNGASPRWWVDATPEHAAFLPGLLMLFPNARVIHVFRDVSSVVTTLTSDAKRQYYKSQHIVMSIEDAFRHWEDTVTACVAAERAYGSEQVMRVERKDLLADPEATLRRCLAFLDECFDPVVLRPFRELAYLEPEHGSLIQSTLSDMSRSAHLLSEFLVEEGVPKYPRDQERVFQLEQTFFESALNWKSTKRRQPTFAGRPYRLGTPSGGVAMRLPLQRMTNAIRRIIQSVQV